MKELQAALETKRGAAAARQEAAALRQGRTECVNCTVALTSSNISTRHPGMCSDCAKIVDSMLGIKSRIMCGILKMSDVKQMQRSYGKLKYVPYALSGSQGVEVILNNLRRIYLRLVEEQHDEAL